MHIAGEQLSMEAQTFISDLTCLPLNGPLLLSSASYSTVLPY